LALVLITQEKRNIPRRRPALASGYALVMLRNRRVLE
jgi:hypothetical protein